MGIICELLEIYVLVIIVRIVLDYIQVPSDHPVGRIRGFLALIIDPLLRPLRSVLPGIPLGGARLDLSPLVLLIGLQIFRGIICRL
jgi:uncharacterized protein YggT (Ycf19 family)